MFEILSTDEARNQLEELRRNPAHQKRYKAVTKTIRLLAANPRHPSLQTHEFTSLNGPHGEKVFEAYAEQSTPAAYRIFWYYGPERRQITLLTVTAHP